MNGPDSEPDRIQGRDAGGTVPPGETPPGEAGTSAGISYPQPELRRGWGPLPIVLIIVVTLLFAVGLIAMAVSLLA
ncbi:DUF6480 family protein [Streptomyces cavernicola]|uniref:DUF6480 family protein n=1 Tax=Streptomyces cavernicola TaxID=3043613 RepID=A0ABT6SI35_9ACTN|nr:DUF6480 family protein [Streptomyces sp. B-S-A6]MDI3406916.1 DUF6480 family protein [Streptomyces sp. B-S-A6]